MLATAPVLRPGTEVVIGELSCEVDGGIGVGLGGTLVDNDMELLKMGGRGGGRSPTANSVK